MKKCSSCIAVFSRFADADYASQQLLKANINQQQISLISKYFQRGIAATDGLANLDKDFLRLGIQRDTFNSFRYLIHNGSFLLLVAGNYEEVELAYQLLQQYEKVEVSIHFNAV